MARKIKPTLAEKEPWEHRPGSPEAVAAQNGLYQGRPCFGAEDG
jgi:hypothetical protein